MSDPTPFDLNSAPNAWVFLQRLFSADFMPHGHCYFWRPEILWLGVLSDVTITLAYYAIPMMLVYFVWKRRDLMFNWIFCCFGAFILLCGTTHLMGVWTVWHGTYRLDALLKAVTALVSIITAGLLWPLIPKALALRSPKELEKINTELQAANTKILEHEKIKSEFFSNISHELRTPLSLIMAPLESTLAGEYGQVPPRWHEPLHTMHNNTVRLLQMVQGLLDFQKLEARKVEVNREPTEIVSLTKAVFHDFTAMMSSRGLRSQFETPLTEVVVEMDRYLYERVMFNLLSNAVKFTPAGGQISVRLDWQNGQLHFTVQDTGIGIADDQMPKLFQRFKQIEGAATRRFEGAGLGLALVKEFSALLGGDVSVKSLVGVGSIFSVELSAPQSEKSAAQMSVSPRRATLIERYELPPIEESEADMGQQETLPKVLIAEDNIELSHYIAHLLKGMCQTKWARDGEEAATLVTDWHPALVLSDVMMPKKDGLSLCRDIKADPSTRETSVIILTALTYREALLKGWEAEAALRTANETLQVKIEEMKTMNHVMMNREERILELKEEIQVLRGQ